MRQAMADFVAAVHEAYLAQARLLPPAEQARLPLLQAPELTVAAAGARNLHVIGTGERFPAPVGQEVSDRRGASAAVVEREEELRRRARRKPFRACRGGAAGGGDCLELERETVNLQLVSRRSGAGKS